MNRKPKSVLVVDDDAYIVLLIRTIIESEGYEVQSATNGLEALELLRSSYRPDLIFLDLMMPVMDGWTLSRELRRMKGKERIPIVILSGVKDVGDRVADLPVDGYVAKPFDYDDLVVWLDQYVAGQSGQSDAV